MPATRYGAFCSTHKSTLRRHGAPDQRGITKADLKPYLVIVRERIAKNEARSIWGLLDQRWLDLVEQVDDIEKRICSAWTRKAAQELHKLAETAKPRAVIETVLAVFVMRELAGNRFKTDKAFNTQLVRRIRALSPSNVRRSNAKVSGMGHRAYSEPPPRVTAAMADLVNASLGAAGIWFAKQMRDREDRLRRTKADLHKALAEIDFG